MHEVIVANNGGDNFRRIVELRRQGSLGPLLGYPRSCQNSSPTLTLLVVHLYNQLGLVVVPWPFYTSDISDVKIGHICLYHVCTCAILAWLTNSSHRGCSSHTYCGHSLYCIRYIWCKDKAHLTTPRNTRVQYWQSWPIHPTGGYSSHILWPHLGFTSNVSCKLVLEAARFSWRWQW